jgi:hypothetical protein
MDRGARRHPGYGPRRGGPGRVLAAAAVAGLLASPACSDSGPAAPSLTTLEISPGGASGAVGSTTQLTATGVYSDGS